MLFVPPLALLPGAGFGLRHDLGALVIQGHRHRALPVTHVKRVCPPVDGARHGLALQTLDISEFEKGGGGLTCLSLLWSPQQGAIGAKR